MNLSMYAPVEQAKTSVEYRVIVSDMLERVRGRSFDIKRVFDTPEAAIEAAKDIIDELVMGEYSADPSISPSVLANRFIYFDYMPCVLGPDRSLPWFDSRRYAEARCYEVCGAAMPKESFCGGMLAPTGRGARENKT
jgi:hypothetical protein